MNEPKGPPCPKCKKPTTADHVDIGVGLERIGKWGCDACRLCEPGDDRGDSEFLFEEKNLDPGIRKTVCWLRRELWFNTTDSGDGVTKFERLTTTTDEDRAEILDEENGAMECPNVAIVVDPTRLVEESERLHDAVLGRIPSLSAAHEYDFQIQASYSPIDQTAVILMLGVDDTMLFPEETKS